MLISPLDPSKSEPLEDVGPSPMIFVILAFCILFEGAIVAGLIWWVG